MINPEIFKANVKIMRKFAPSNQKEKTYGTQMRHSRTS